MTDHTTLPTIYLPHGGGPCFFMDWTRGPADTWDKTRLWLENLLADLAVTPKSILIISAHWENDVVRVTAGARPPLIYDYQGFPPHTYELTWPAPGDPALAANIVARLQDAGIPAGLVQDAREVIEDEQLRDRGYFAQLEHAEAGLRRYDGPGWRMSESPVALHRAAPMLGEHTFEVAQDLLGLSPDEIANLVAEGVLQ